MTTRNPSQTTSKLQAKNKKESIYAALFSPYQSPYKYQIYFINQSTSSQDLDYLIDIVQTSTDFIIDTESAFKSNIPALIQIYFLQSTRIQSPLLLVEIQHLPHYSTALFSQLKKLFYCIFNVKSHFYSWGPLTNELRSFSSCLLFTFPLYVITHDLQSQFKTWFNTWITSYDSTSINESITTDDVVIINAPTYDPHLLLPTSLMNKKKFNSHESWSLQHAVLYTFGLHLSKRETLRQWDIGLDINLPTCDHSFSINYRQKLINYACLDCVSVAHINLFMHQSELPLDLTFVKEQIITGEYFVSTKSNVASDIFQLDDACSSSSFEQIDAQVMAVHVPNDRHQSMPLITSMDSQHLVSVSPLESTPDEIITNLNSQSVECSPHKRSNNAKRRKNQKSSLRHRRKRYHHEIIRPANMKITSIKQLLRKNHIKYLNIHVVHSTLFIGVKSDGFKQLYEQIIPADMFV
ncbi:unnamed protein product [Rotaria socialis]|uniref:Uncharacterized protein n=2 Tax=Rotaria socialis TaxID=392032 RepID=A0A818AZ78_9BILA|nr:unnamed protein product [Rotaria socialis]CAF3766258.1 unnamed protein product [Rotaria socialis]CAF4570958.1 unnamed protein product [Rotaria socialis]CAF4836051.1 unnamed protein product [Rotaria socialis]